jgi:hypothetical protein
VRSPIGNRGFSYIIKLVKHIFRIIIILQDKTVINVRWTVLGGKVFEKPDGKDICDYQSKEKQF